MDAIKFVVLDEEDLEVASTHLQDAVVKVSDVLWRPGEKRVVVALNRFDWESADDPNHEFPPGRAGLRFERVLSWKCRQVDPARKDAISQSSRGLVRRSRRSGWHRHAHVFRRSNAKARGRVPRGRTCR